MLSNTLQPAWLRIATAVVVGLEGRMGHSHRVVRRLCSDKRAFFCFAV